MIRRKLAILAAVAALTAAGQAAHAAIRITEWMYDGAPGEFVELTNVGGPAVDFTGWSYSDESNAPGTISLSNFGVVAPGETVIFTEADEAAFRTAWSLAPSVKVIGSVTNNLGRNDAIYVFNAASTVADVLDFGDQSTPGAGPRTQGRSGNPTTLAALGANSPALWALSAVGDTFGSYASTGGIIANPGNFSLIPEPSSLALAAIALVGVRRRRQPS